MPPRSLQRNAADPDQVRFAERKEAQAQELFELGLKAVMATKEGRVVIWGLLDRAGVYRSPFDPSGSKIYYNAGRSDFGRELLALAIEHAEDDYLRMEAEARRRARSVGREADAVQADGGASE